MVFIVCGFNNEPAGEMCSFCGKPLVAAGARGSVSLASAGAASPVVPVASPLHPAPPPVWAAANPNPANSSNKLSSAWWIVIGSGAVAAVLVFLVVIGWGVKVARKATEDAAHKRVAQLVHEAVATDSQTGQGSHGVLDDVMWQYFRDVRQLGIQYQQNSHDADTSELQILYRPETFSGRDEIEKMMSQLKLALKIDTDQEQGLQDLFAKAKERIEASSLPDFQKQSFEQGFEKGIGQTAQFRTPAVEAEKDWFDACQDLYSYAEDNLSSIAVQDGRLIINDAAVRDTFNQKLQNAQAKQTEFKSRKQIFNEKSAELLQQIGISQQDANALRAK